MTKIPSPPCFHNANPLDFSFNDICAIIAGTSRFTFPMEDPWRGCHKLGGNVFEFMEGDAERLIERAVAYTLVMKLVTAAAPSGHLKAYAAIHLVDQIIKDALMGILTKFQGVCSGNGHSTNHMESLMGMVINEKLRRIYNDLNLSLLPPYDAEAERLSK